MAKLKILVVEDDHFLAEELVADLEGLGYNPLPYQTESSGANVVVKTNTPDVILMDIELGDGFNGIELAMVINVNYKIPIIYLTATSSKYLQSVSKTGYAGFLTKPYTKEQLQASIELAILTQLDTATSNSQIKKIYVKQQDSYQALVIDEIQYIEAQGWESKFYTNSGEKLVKVTFANLEKQIKNSMLVRVQHSFIINMDKVVEIGLGNKPFIKIGDKDINISHKYVPDIDELFNIIRTKI
jgi:DNA-binding LytR/AlgR family response regulator